ncbi:MAG: formate dehydrogenase [Ideonella sp.]|nr:formate dehydrogenase [Ideonella sp.]MCC7458738.1 hypothetical protein [Nitrospira sp.]
MKQAKKPASDQPTLQRRRMLGVAGTSGALAVAATVMARRHGEPQAPASGDEPSAPARGGGYRVTDHVLRYYRTAKV